MLVLAACSNEEARRRHVENGEQHLRAGRPREAIVELRNAVALDESSGEARVLLAEAYAASGEPERAYHQYVRAADLLPHDVNAQLAASRFLMRGGQYEDARTRAQRAVSQDPQNIEAHIVLGQALAALQDGDGALAQLAEAIRLDPSRSQTHLALAQILVAQGARDEARATFEKAVALEPTSIDAHLALARFLWTTGETAAADASLRRVLALDADRLETHRAMAAFYLASNQAEKAERHLAAVANATRTPEARLTLVDYYLQRRRLDDARRELEQMTGNQPAQSEVAMRLAHIAYVQSRHDEARELVQQVLRREPNHPGALLLAGRWAMLERRPDEALQRAQAALAGNPRLIAAHALHGDAAARTRRTAEAVRSFTEVLRLDPTSVDARIKLSQLHLVRHNIDSAVLMAEEAVAADPDRTDARLALIRAWIARGDLHLAEAELASVRRRADGAAIDVVDGVLRMQAGELGRARAAFVRALERDPDSDEALSGLVGVDALRGADLSQARTRVASRLAAAPNDAALLLLAAKASLAARDPAQAESFLRRSIAVDPLGVEQYALLARLLTEERRLEEALRSFDESVRQGSPDIGARTMSALLRHTRGDVIGAEARYQEVLKLEPRAAVAANNLAAILAERGENLVYAQQLAESAIEQFPGDAEMHDTLGRVYHARKLGGPAIRQFQKSIMLAPGRAHHYYRLGLAYALNGETDRAREAFEHALRLDPRLHDAKSALAAIGP